MRKVITIIIAVVLVMCLSPPAHAAAYTGAQTDLTFTYTPAEPSYFVNAWVEKIPGNQNRLHITVTEYLPDGSVNVITETFMIPNNAEGTYQVGGYSVYVDTKGNIQIRQCEVVNYTQSGNQTTPLADTLVNAVNAQFIGITETAKNSKVWVLTFKVTLTYSDGTTKDETVSFSLSGNNANQDGKYRFESGHQLAGYTLVYDIKGNGSNIKDFRLVSN